MPHRQFPRAIIFGLLALLSSPCLTPARAAYSAWTDTAGNTFKAEPAAVFGPLALFRQHAGGGRMLGWKFLSPAECVRFYEEARQQPARADDWAEAKNSLSSELAGNVRRIEHDKLVPADFKGRPEPEFFVVFYANHGVGNSWDMIGQSITPFTQLQAAFPHLVEGVFFGLQHSASDQTDMALSQKMPWLVTDLSGQRYLPTLIDLAPLGDKDAYGIVVVNWQGVPVFAANSPDAAGVKMIFDKLRALLDLMRSDNPHSWPDRAYYLRAVEPVIHAADRSDPILVGNPLVATGLRERKITRVDATLAVAADGRVTAVTISPQTGVPDGMIAPLADALKKACVMVPAIDHGQFVPGSYHYQSSVPQ